MPLHYAVLASVSGRYSPLEGRLLTCYSPVRHSMHSPKRALIVRLACLRHAASVDSEPGSNSPVRSFGRRCDRSRCAAMACLLWRLIPSAFAGGLTRTHAISRVFHRTQFSRTEGSRLPSGPKTLLAECRQVNHKINSLSPGRTLAGSEQTRRFFTGSAAGRHVQPSHRRVPETEGSGLFGPCLRQRGGAGDAPARRQGERLYGLRPNSVQEFFMRPRAFCLST